MASQVQDWTVGKGQAGMAAVIYVLETITG